MKKNFILIKRSGGRERCVQRFGTGGAARRRVFVFAKDLLLRYVFVRNIGQKAYFNTS